MVLPGPVDASRRRPIGGRTAYVGNGAIPLGSGAKPHASANPCRLGVGVNPCVATVARSVRTVALIVGGFLAVVGGVAVLGFSSWLHQPGFAGDPNGRLLDGAPYGVLMSGGLGLVVAGVVLLRQGVIRRHRPS